MIENNFLIARLKKLMGDKSNRVFAKECGVSETVIRKILKGDDPNLSTLKKIAEEVIAGFNGATMEYKATEQYRNMKEVLDQHPQVVGYAEEAIHRAKDPTGALQFKMVEPVPVRLTQLELVLASAQHPYAAMLFIEHEASPEGQDVIDKQDFIGSIFYPGSNMSKTIQGKKLCINGFADFHNSNKWMAMAVEAFGFPKESTK
jgi:transcriptional regulator with XRE-family HTH domain